MRPTTGLSWLFTCLLLCTPEANATAWDRRQLAATPSASASPTAAPSTIVSSSSGFPALPSASTPGSAPGSAATSAIASSSAATPLVTGNSTVLSTNISANVVPSTTSATHSPTTTAGNFATNGTAASRSDPLPLKPKITPGLSIAGVVLILSGSAYLLIGIKNKWIHIFLSSAYLTSLSTTVLIVYVMSPPISSAVQGAYFVAAFMTGVLFGAGSLMFPDITEGLGCILGGVCLSMWFLVLKPGGSITGTVGKIVFVLVLGVAVWSLSFIRRTRPYAMIVAASFSGATAVVLGIDCFSQAGLKEFWLYIWALNDNVFPLNTNTYPVTRAMQVEIAAIVLLCIVGIISQLKLWKVVKERREKKEAEQRDVERRKSAMEEAMGRFLEARTDREKAQWERIYGPQWDTVYNNHVRGSRSTIGDASTVLATDNRKSWVSLREVPAGSAAAAGVELNRLSLSRADHNSTLRSKRQSAVTVHTIPEDDETQTEASAGGTDTQSARSADGGPDPESTAPPPHSPPATSLPLLPFMIPNGAGAPTSSGSPVRPETTPRGSHPQLAEKRKSGSSILERLSGQHGIAPPASSSEEALVVPERSRASSIAATLNDEPGELDLQSVHSDAVDGSDVHDRGLASGTTSSSRLSYIGDQPPSPAALSVEFDPEELARPLQTRADGLLKPAGGSSKRDPSKDNVGRTHDSNAHHTLAAPSRNGKGKTPLPAEPLPSESLTAGALVQVPSQLSDLVLTYRTNEWAKHISTADEPDDDQPTVVLEDAWAESPVQLVETPAPVRLDELRQTATTHVSASRQPAEALTRSHTRLSTGRHPRDTLESKKGTPGLERSASEQSGALAPTIVVRPPTAASGPSASSRPAQLSRSSSSPQITQPLPTTIDENAETQFPLSSPSLSPPSTSPTQSVSPPLRGQPDQSAASLHLPRSASSQTLAISNLSNQMYQQARATTSDTRLSSSRDSRQPARRASTFVPGKRDKMLAEWQGSLQRENSMTAIPTLTLEQRRAEMMLERRQSQKSKHEEEESQQYREKAVEQAMRTTDMQALHREAMRKLQAKANKHV